MMLEDIRREVREACEGPANLLTPAFYHEHLRVVAAHAAALAPALGADPEIVELAAYLHDISAVLDFDTLPTHAALSADMAGAMLARYGYADARIEMVASAIGRHGAPLRSGEGTPEEICLSNADAMAQITAPAFWLFFAFTLRKLDFAAGKDWYARKVRENWDAIVPEARALIRAEHARALAVAG